MIEGSKIRHTRGDGVALPTDLMDGWVAVYSVWSVVCGLWSGGCGPNAGHGDRPGRLLNSLVVHYTGYFILHPSLLSPPSLRSSGSIYCIHPLNQRTTSQLLALALTTRVLLLTTRVLLTSSASSQRLLRLTAFHIRRGRTTNFKVKLFTEIAPPSNPNPTTKPMLRHAGQIKSYKGNPPCLTGIAKARLPYALPVSHSSEITRIWLIRYRF